MRRTAGYQMSIDNGKCETDTGVSKSAEEMVTSV